MNFDFTSEQKRFKEDISNIFTSEKENELDELEKEGAEGIRRITRKYLNSLSRIGYLGLGLDAEKANRESESSLITVTLLIAQEELAKVSQSLFMNVEISTRLFGGLIKHYGSEEQIDHYLYPVIRGEIIGGLPLFESSNDFENQKIEIRALKKGSGFSIEGQNLFVGNAPIADTLALFASVEDRNLLFLIDSNQNGFLMGARTETMGYRGTAISSVNLRNCIIESNRVVGFFEKNDLFTFLGSVEDEILAVASLGVMHNALEASKRYAYEKKRRGRPLIAHQDIGFKLAEMVTLFQTAQLMAYRTAWLWEIQDSDAKVIAASMKVFVTEAAEVLASHAMEIMGKEGYLLGSVAERAYRNAKLCQLLGTQNDMVRMNIADRVLSKH